MTLEERIASNVARPRFNAAMLGSFAGVALLLAAVGVRPAGGPQAGPLRPSTPNDSPRRPIGFIGPECPGVPYWAGGAWSSSGLRGKPVEALTPRGCRLERERRRRRAGSKSKKKRNNGPGQHELRSCLSMRSLASAGVPLVHDFGPGRVLRAAVGISDSRARELSARQPGGRRGRRDGRRRDLVDALHRDDRVPAARAGRVCHGFITVTLPVRRNRGHRSRSRRRFSGARGLAAARGRWIVHGTGVAAMHYTGMTALRMPARISYSPGLRSSRS